MGSIQHRVGGMLTLAVLSGAVVLLGAAPAWAGEVFVHVAPGTVQAGHMVRIRASCRENWFPAKVESPAFGTITVHPQEELLTATALVPEHTRPGTYRVRLSCPDRRIALTKLRVLPAGHPSRGPATGFGGGSGDVPGGWLLTGGLASTIAGMTVGLVALRARSANRRAARAR